MPGPETRDALARALERLGQDPDNHDLRLHTADLAIAVALRQADPFTTEVVDALSVDSPNATDAQQAELKEKVALARAARIALVSHGSQAEERLGNPPITDTRSARPPLVS